MLNSNTVKCETYDHKEMIMDKTYHWVSWFFMDYKEYLQKYVDGL